MKEWWEILMLSSGGLFSGTVLSIAQERVPAWREADFRDFRTAFAHTLRRVDRLQPVLLVVCLVSTIGFALSAAGTARTLAGLAGAGFLLILVGSAAWLIPVQRRLVAPGAERPSSELEKLRADWLRGHLIRTFAALATLTLAVVAAAS